MAAMKNKLVVAVAALLPLLVACALIAAMLAVLPGHLDEFLLTDDDYCHVSSSPEESTSEQPSVKVKVDYGEYGREAAMPVVGAPDHRAQQRPTTRPKVLPDEEGRIRRAKRSVLWRLSLYLREQQKRPSEDDDDDSATATACPVRNEHGDRRRQIESLESLHPMCRSYRRFRSRVRFRRLTLPWNWHCRREFRARDLSFHWSNEDDDDDVALFASSSSGGEIEGHGFSSTTTWRRVGWSYFVEAVRVDVVPPAASNVSARSSLEIKSADVSLVRGVVSATLRGVSINVVVGKGGFSLGALPIQEAFRLLPDPPEHHGLFPRIGVLNITNVTLNLYENTAGDESSSSSNLLLRVSVPDEFFAPVTNLTIARQNSDGIDQKDFLPMVESSISAALRRHVLDEAAAVFRGGLDRAHEAQERLQRVANMTQELYLDKWIGTGARAWQQSRRNVWNGVIDGTAPLARAVEDVLSDLRDIVSGPVTPLAVVVSHHWNRTMEVFDKRSSSFDRSMVRGCFDKWVAKTNDFKHKHGISRHFAELRDAFENFVSKSGQDLESLVESCELEVKDMWLDWHRQFMPELPS